MAVSTSNFAFVYQYCKAFSRWLLPYTCILCHGASTRDLDLCLNCEADLPWITKACPSCGMPMADIQPANLMCGHCIHEKPSFQQTLALFHYQHPIDGLILNLKFHHRLLYAKVLGEIMAERVSNYLYPHYKPDLIIPIPLHKKRLIERGFNQALELARPVAKKLKVPIEFNACQRIRNTQAQSAIPANQRKKNLNNAFAINKNLTANHVLVIDDVMTTAYTMEAFCKELRLHGVKKVDVCCIARTTKQASK